MTRHKAVAAISGIDPPFQILAPEVQTTPFVLCSPHSGRTYPDHFLAQSRLDPLTLRKSEDCFVDELFSEAAALGAPLISACFPRAFLDVNREPYELDPELFAEPLPDFANTQSVRVVGGLGTIARIVADGEEIYDAPLSVAQALNRIDQLYMPFHEALTDLLEATKRQFGHAILIDCHSMPSSLMTQTGAPPRPDFVIGDRFGASCDRRITRCLRDALASLGYNAQLNRPYAGGFITEHYGRPQQSVHAVQLELNRGLYLDEQSIRPTAGFAPLKANLTKLLSRLFAEIPSFLSFQAAAE